MPIRTDPKTFESKPPKLPPNKAGSKLSSVSILTYEVVLAGNVVGNSSSKKPEYAPIPSNNPELALISAFVDKFPSIEFEEKSTSF